MTCKDCYHYEMCLPRVAVSNDKICQYFKDKSRIIELPCKVTNGFKEELTKYCYERCVYEL